MTSASAPSFPELLTKHGSNCQCPIWHARCRGVKPPQFWCWLNHQNNISHLKHQIGLTSWNLQNSPRILFLRLFPTSGCPEMGYIPIYGCFARKMNINQFRSNQFLTVSGCFHYPHKNSHIEW
jgi:hypothetical protein